MRVAFTVNGEPREAEVWEGESLLFALRERLGLPGSKNACEQGECGSCSVLLDRVLVCSCLVLAAQADGHEVVTVEGLADDDRLHPVQQAFVEAGAVQSGFCTPGLVVAAADLLERSPEPSDDEIREALSGNLCRCTGYEKNFVRHIVIRHGEPGVEGEVAVDGVYETGIQDQAFLGPESGLAVPDGKGGLDIYVATQWLHVDRDQVAPCLRLPPEMVRLHLAGVGGAFGGREDISIQIHAAMLALHTNRPVKMVYGREESFVGHVHRHPAKIWAEHRATREGKLVCVRMRILLDGGAYASSSTAVCSNAASFAIGPYGVDNALIESTAVYTNNPPCGAMRGFGAVQTCFAAEAQLDKLAAALDIDPIELRLLNALEQ